MKKAFVVRGMVETVFYGEGCDDYWALRSLVQQVKNVDEEAFEVVEIVLAENTETHIDQLEDVMFCEGDLLGELSTTEMKMEEYMENIEQRLGMENIKADLEKMGWEFDDGFEEDLYEVLDDWDYVGEKGYTNTPVM